MVGPENKDIVPEKQPMRPLAWGPIPTSDEIEQPRLPSEEMTQQEVAAAENMRQYMRHLRETADDPSLPTEVRAEALDEIRTIGLKLAGDLYPHMTDEHVNREFEQRGE